MARRLSSPKGYPRRLVNGSMAEVFYNILDGKTLYPIATGLTAEEGAMLLGIKKDSFYMKAHRSNSGTKGKYKITSYHEV